jgi:hypothetical protein
MCLACEEMDLYFAYLEQREAKPAAAAASGNGIEAAETSIEIVPAGSPEVPPAVENAASA